MNVPAKISSVVVALAVAAAGGVFVFGGSTDDASIDAGARAAAAAEFDSSPFHTDLGGELVQPGAEVVTGVTLPGGAAARSVLLTGAAVGQFDVEAISTRATDDHTGQWWEMRARSHAATALRFTAELGYAMGSGSP